MNRNRFLMILSLIVLAALVGGAVSSKAFTTQTAQTRLFESIFFTTYKSPGQVIIKTRQGQVLSVLEVPIGVNVFVTPSKGIREGDRDSAGTNYVFEGNVRIETWAQAGQNSGPPPFRLDIQDAVVELKTMK